MNASKRHLNTHSNKQKNTLLHQIAQKNCAVGGPPPLPSFEERRFLGHLGSLSIGTFDSSFCAVMWWGSTCSPPPQPQPPALFGAGWFLRRFQPHPVGGEVCACLPRHSETPRGWPNSSWGGRGGSQLGRPTAMQRSARRRCWTCWWPSCGTPGRWTASTSGRGFPRKGNRVAVWTRVCIQTVHQRRHGGGLSPSRGSPDGSPHTSKRWNASY